MTSSSSGEPPVRWSERPPSPSSGPDGGPDPKTTSDSASLVNSVNSTSNAGQGESGYYEGRSDSYKHWWDHPKIKANYKLVLAAVGLVVIGISKTLEHWRILEPKIETKNLK